jgi:protein involved in ribonucleotide reduction
MSITGNVKNFVERVGMESYEINPTNPFYEIKQDYIVVAPSYEGLITEDVIDFVSYKDNLKYLQGFASSGNINFNDLYCVNAKELSKHFSKPIVFTFEDSGTDKDIRDFKKEVDKIAIT